MNIPLFKVFMNPNVCDDLFPVLSSGYISQGPQVEKFEIELKKYLKYPFLLTLNSGTSALTLAIRLLNLNSEDEILTTPLTCTATNWSILANNIKIKWVDVDPKTCNMDLNSLKSKLSEKTKAILVVHWGGYPVDLDRLKEIQDYSESTFGFRPIIIEDCAHAFGAVYKDKYIGTYGNICCFSFQAIKLLTSGDGGMITLPNQEMYNRAKLLRWFGIDREKRSGGDFRLEADIPEWGYKFHMNDINATIGLSNLPFVNSNLKIVRRNADYYRWNLNPTILLNEEEGFNSSYWIYTIKVEEKDNFINYMKDKGITVSQVHKRNDKHSCVSEFITELPQLDLLEKYIISIPVGWWLSEDSVKYITDTVNHFIKN